MDGEDPAISGMDTKYNYCGECEDVLESPKVPAIQLLIACSMQK